MPDLKPAWGCCSKFYSTATLRQNEPRTKHRVTKNNAMGETRVRPFADQHRKRHGRQFLSVLPRRLRAAALLQRCRRKLTGLERCMTIDPQACTKTVKGYGELTTSSLDKSTFPLEVEHSFNRTVTALFPFSAVWLEQATRSFHGDGRRTFSVRSRRRCTAPGR